MSKNSVFLSSSGFPTRFHLVLSSLLVTPSSSWCRLPNFLGNQLTYSYLFIFLSITVDDVGLAPGKWQCYVSLKCLHNKKENTNISRHLCFLRNPMAIAKMGMTGMDMSQCSWLRNIKKLVIMTSEACQRMSFSNHTSHVIASFHYE